MVTNLTPSSSRTIFPVQMLAIMINLQTCGHLANHALSDGVDVHRTCARTPAVARLPLRVADCSIWCHEWSRWSDRGGSRLDWGFEPSGLRKRAQTTKKRMEVLAPTELRIDSLLCDSKQLTPIPLGAVTRFPPRFTQVTKLGPAPTRHMKTPYFELDQL